jgi:hypothetical protein
MPAEKPICSNIGSEHLTITAADTLSASPRTRGEPLVHAS